MFFVYYLENPTSCNIGVYLGSNSTNLAPYWTNLGSTWNQLWPTWGNLGLTWGQLGANSGVLGPTWGARTAPQNI